ncbi:transcription elongation factor GreA [Pseudonocardia dioxanivorans CB1190]|uniref:Transcription elongation factor GreA n=2 Tax=Pseudonocardia dioxanivorans TaxID=240495 RepID=F4CZF4_PSEUX|nr:transcription elongation factor GreA [Pseudonocardia dioxanivorans CB1190]
MTTAPHNERHALLEELDLLRARRRELEWSLISDDHRPHDFGEHGATTALRDEIDWVDRRIRDLVHQVWEAGRPDGDTSERVGLYSVVTLRFPDGSSETLQVTRFPDEDVPAVTPESPLGRALLGAQPGDEITWKAPDGRLRARVERVRRPA